MAIIKKYNAKYNTTYVYDSVSYWDKDKKQPRSKRKLIGKIDPATGEIVPTGGRGRRPKRVDPIPDAAEAITAPEDAPSEPQVPDAPAGMDETDLRVLYEDCRRRLLETEAALAKAQSAVSRLTAEKQELRGELERILKRLSH